MKIYKIFIIILIVFLKTGNVLSSNEIFTVNNIEIEIKSKISNEELANKAIKKGFIKLTDKILLKEDSKKLQKLKLSEIKDLVTYYKISNKIEQNKNLEKTNFNISFDKNKIHNLFYNKGISYSKIYNKELYILPILKKDNQIFIYNNNFFYKKWNENYNDDLIEFILPSANIEIIQKINSNKGNILNFELRNLFKEYAGSNLALILIEDNNFEEEKIYFKTEISGKSIIRKINLKRLNFNKEEFNQNIITAVKKEITNIIKSQNLIDIRVPSFLKVKFTMNKENNLVKLRSKLRTIETIENIYIQKFNNKTVFLKIKYLGNLNKVIRELKNQNIILRSNKDNWSIEII